ncbi:hypothetical protein MSSIH_2127 [Methanosarcina siciliae HI350]|uniref:Uncharacterized protein n=1 Tax=Methanosarcina siciliae HI350 TaxID=1434119 RepID=A0A0E3PF53_9EURY|nr:hypothetical protein MSSIH_2127 [Methanosarcina siciliae HI350]
MIRTKYGDLVPQYGDPGVRKKQLKALSFYKSGKIKNISLEQQTEINTSIGTFPAELVTFFEDGSLNSLFPLNGQISGFWSEEEEGALAQKYDFTFPFGSFSAKIIGLRFYPDGKVRSLILWPNERIIIDTPAGKIPIRVGFKLYEDGSIESAEPAKPVPVETPIGTINAYDANALGIEADKNSLGFERNGRLTSLSTFDIISVKTGSGEKRVTFPKLKPGLTDDYEKVPIKLRFVEDSVTIDDGKQANEYRISDTTFKITGGDYTEQTSCGDCAQCKICF